ncbi:MAG: hypothetical protein AAGJ87_13830, partial [Pseudomonadota bacterium]
ALFLGGACSNGATSANRAPAPEPSAPFTASSPGGLATPGGALTTASAHHDVFAGRAAAAGADAIIDAASGGAIAEANASAAPTTATRLDAFVLAAFDADAAIDVPQYYETALEADVRKALFAGAGDFNISLAEGASGDPDAPLYRLSYSAEVTAPGARRRLSSRLRIEPDFTQLDRVDQTRIDPISNPGFRPALALGGGRAAPLRNGPVVTVAVTLLRGDERVWRATAEAPLSGAARGDVARSLVADVLALWGRDGAFSATPRPRASESLQNAPAAEQ